MGRKSQRPGCVKTGTVKHKACKGWKKPMGNIYRKDRESPPPINSGRVPQWSPVAEIASANGHSLVSWFRAALNNRGTTICDFLYRDHIYKKLNLQLRY